MGHFKKRNNKKHSSLKLPHSFIGAVYTNKVILDIFILANKVRLLMAVVEKIITALFGSKQQRDLKKLFGALHNINEKESWANSLTPEDFPKQTAQFKERIAKGESLDDLVPEAFALAREAAYRVLGERPYNVQILGAITLHQGNIMELKTGEGKTLASVPAAYLNSLAGKGVHVVTVNDYLAERDANWMRPVFDYLGVSVGSILTSMDNETRKGNYNADITYGTNKEFGFDYLRDNMKVRSEDKIQRAHHYCIIDEVDSILIDESRTPLIISGPAEDDRKSFMAVNRIANSFTECEKDPNTGDYPEEPVGDYKLNEKSKNVQFTTQGIQKAEELLQKHGIIQGSLYDNFEYLHYTTQAIRAHKLYDRDVEYVVQDGKVEIVDQFTGRVLHGRRYSDGLHQAIEAKEGIQVARRNKTLASITLQNYFKMYNKISGMTGTADTEAAEFSSIYGVDVVVIPTNRPVRRDDRQDLIYFDLDCKIKAIVERVKELQKKGQPVLVGTASIESSEVISKHFSKNGIRHEVLNAKNHAREAFIIAEAGAKGAVTIATNMAGRGTDIKLGGSPEHRARKKVGSDASPEEYKAALLEAQEEWRKDAQEVKDLGGLFILGTERHESRRIDNQLRGRSGRQGDAGVSEFYLSLDDTLMRLFARNNMKGLMQRMGFDEGEPITHKMITRSVEKAQGKVEERNFDIRKHLLEYDDVLNEQRRVIYEKRDEILRDDAIIGRAIDAVQELVSSIVENFAQNSTTHRVSDFRDTLRTQFGYDSSKFSDTQLQGNKEYSTIKDEIIKDLLEEINEKTAEIPKEQFNDFLRYYYLREIDQGWQNHLEALEELRESVSLRSYAQKNPLLEYKLEGFDFFENLIDQIRTKMARLVVRVKIRKNPVQNQPTREMQAVQQNLGGSDPVRKTEADQVRVVRSVPKVGRNEPCPCGSGKKYKQCHGR